MEPGMELNQQHKLREDPQTWHAAGNVLEHKISNQLLIFEIRGAKKRPHCSTLFVWFSISNFLHVCLPRGSKPDLIRNTRVRQPKHDYKSSFRN